MGFWLLLLHQLLLWLLNFRLRHWIEDLAPNSLIDQKVAAGEIARVLASTTEAHFLHHLLISLLDAGIVIDVPLVILVFDKREVVTTMNGPAVHDHAL